MVQLGIEVLQASKFAPLQGKRVGLMTNPSAVTRQLVSTYDIFRTSDEVQLAGLYGAEHGFLGAVSDGVAVDSQVDALTGVPIYSLYGKHYRPTRDMLSNIDVMVCDIQDIGVRYYTFVWTVTHVIEACGEYDIPVIILDRPNPLGDTMAGRLLDEKFASLVGRTPVPILHGLTLGELSLAHNALWNPHPADLTVIACENLTASQTIRDTQLPFIPPSPNMSHISTAEQYAGSCLIEGTNLSEGRGTTLPFEIVGAPFMDALKLADELNSLNLSGVGFRPHFFTPSASKFAGEMCLGVQVHIQDRATFDAISTWLHVIETIARLYPDDFAYLPPYAQTGVRHFDRLIGSDEVRLQLEAGASVQDVMSGWAEQSSDFRVCLADYRLYQGASS